MTLIDLYREVIMGVTSLGIEKNARSKTMVCTAS